MAHVVVVGAGGMGGYFAGVLAEAGNEVTLLARGSTLEALTEQGILLDEPDTILRTVRGVVAVESLTGVAPADVVVVCVKAWQVAAVASSLLPVVGERTVVIPVQNGVESGDRLAEVLGAQAVVGGVGAVFAVRTAPATYTRRGGAPIAEIGPLGAVAPTAERIADAAELLTAAGIKCRVSADIRRSLWRKLMFIASMGGVGALAAVPFGEMRAVPRTRDLLESAVREVAAVARAGGVAITDGDIDATIERIDTSEPSATASMARDILAGLPSELDDQTGSVVRNGERWGVATPVHGLIYAALSPRELRARQ